MDPVRNPFSPGAGAPPPELVGRDHLLEQARILTARVLATKAAKSLMITGLRGVGKTVLLNEIERRCAAQGYRTLMVEVHEEKSLPRLLTPPLRKLLFELDRLAGLGEKTKRALSALAGFASAVRLSVGGVEVGLDIEGLRGVADSGDLEADLPDLFEAIGEAAEERATGVAVLLDEVQYLGSQELSALIMAMHRMQQRQLPVVVVGAGLPTLPALAGDSKSYSERLFDFPNIGPLAEPDVARALQDPVRAQGVEFTVDALQEISRLTQGYPYFIQEWGYQSWNHADGPEITDGDVQAATPRVTQRLDEGFFRVRFDRLTPKEKEVMRAMAGMGPGPYATGDVAQALQMKTTSLGPVRAKLLSKGMIYSPAHGQLAFTVPLFDEFMLRAMS